MTSDRSKRSDTLEKQGTERSVFANYGRSKNNTSLHQKDSKFHEIYRKL